jgi:16S rRNA (uracil1498-N3)-methyltransferase
MARRRFFVDEIRNGRARIVGDDAHHLTRVLRVEPGQRFEISDNRDVYLAEVETARKSLVEFSLVERLPAVAPGARIDLFASLIRFERFEDLIEKATELGVAHIVPVAAERSEKGLARAAEKRLPRWRRIAREASEQSRRARLPEIESPIELMEAVREESAHRLLLDEEAAPGILGALPVNRKPDDSIALLVGPEGGWTDRERAAIVEAGWRAVSLGSTILRAETAAVAGLAIVNAAWRTDSPRWTSK